jgi:small glutamine-rich tetratricopeptide repeat-containing protein alpha
MTKDQRDEEAEKLKNKANDLLKERKWDEAVGIYTEALKYSESAVIYANRAVPYGKLQKFDEAIADCKKAVEMDPTYIKGHARLGYMYFHTKSYAKAADAYKEGLKYDPTNESFKNDLAKIATLLQPAVLQPQGQNANFANMMQQMAGQGGGAGFGGMDGMGGPNMPGNFMEMLSNPQFMQAAQQFMMGNPNLMNWAQQVAQDPEVVQQIFQGKIPEGMPIPDNVEEMMANMPPNLMQNFQNFQAGGGGFGNNVNNKEGPDDGGIGGL